jgi:hypothetical protein
LCVGGAVFGVHCGTVNGKVCYVRRADTLYYIFVVRLGGAHIHLMSTKHSGITFVKIIILKLKVNITALIKR